MSRLSLALVALVGILAGGLGVSLLRPAPTVDDTHLRTVVSDMLAADKAATPVTEPEIDRCDSMPSSRTI